MNNNFVYMTYPSTLKESLRLNLSHENSFNTELYLPKFLYIIHLFYQAIICSPEAYRLKGKRINQGFLGKKFLRVKMGVASKMISLLRDWGYIKRIKGYTPGKKSFSYKLTKELEGLPIDIHKHTAEKSTSFIYHIINNDNAHASPIVKYQLEILKNHISVSQKGISYIISQYPELKFTYSSSTADNCRINYSYANSDPKDIVLLSIFYSAYYSSRDHTSGRLYSNITNLTTIFREYILMDGQPILQTDIVNSQLLFGAFAIEEFCKKSGKRALLKKPDFLAFKNACQDGEIYERIAKEGGTKQVKCLQTDRKKFKQLFFKMVWFADVYKRDRNKNRYGERKEFNTGIAKAFKSLYPTVLTIINEMKENDASGFAVQLQKLEADMMLDNIGKKLKTRGIKFLTIHDSFVVNNDDDRATVENLIREEFLKKYQCEPKFKSV